MQVRAELERGIEEFQEADFAKVQVTFDQYDHVVTQENGEKVLVVNFGKREKLHKRNWIKLIRKITLIAKKNKIQKLAINLEDFLFEGIYSSQKDVAELLTVNLSMANYKFRKYLKKPENGWGDVEELVIVSKNAEIEEGIKKGIIIAEEVSGCRDLANTPGSDIFPETLGQYTKDHLEPLGVKVTVFDYEKIKELKMGGLEAVGKGSIEKPRFIIMEHMHGEKDEKPLMLVGKGVTYDTGGLNLKPTQGGSLEVMFLDMSGAASVIHTMAIAARLGLKKNIIALVPTAENMISQDSYRPGDIITMSNNKTVQVLNTDAEGRLILADALVYAQQYDPRLVVSVATLTGAACIAVGEDTCASFTQDHDLSLQSQEWGLEVGDYVWPLPLWDVFSQTMKGSVSDLRNLGHNKKGGASMAAAFLNEFVNYRFLHIDMAPHMTGNKFENLDSGASGSPVRLLTRLLEES